MTITDQPVSIHNSEHYVWGEQCDGWHLLKQPDLSVIQERVPAGATEQKHYHSKSRQFFYVLTGRARMEFESHAIEFGPGEAIGVVPGVVHKFTNPFDNEVVFLVISSPSTSGDRVVVPEPAV